MDYYIMMYKGILRNYRRGIMSESDMKWNIEVLNLGVTVCYFGGAV